MFRHVLPYLVLAAWVPAEGALLLRADFDDFEGRGLAPVADPAVLDSRHWRVAGLSDGDSAYGETRDGGDFARGLSTGGVSRGGLYGFVVGRDPSPDVALGFQATSGDLTPGLLALRLANPLPVVIDTLEIRFDLYVRDDGERSSRLALHLPGWRAAPLLETATPSGRSPEPVWTRTELAATAGALGWSPGAELEVQWLLDDFAGLGARDELAIDNLQVVGLPGPPAQVGEPPSHALLGASLLAVAGCGARRRVGG